MKVLLLAKQLAEANGLGAMVREAGHQVTVSTSEATTRTGLADPALQLALLTVAGADEQVLQLIGDCRKASSKLLIALLGDGTPEDYMARAYLAGLDLDLSTAHGAGLLARLRALGNLARTAPAPAKKSTSSIRTVAGAALDPVLRTAHAEAWRNAPVTLATAASTFLTLPAAVAEIGDGNPSATHASAITLGNVEEQLEIRIAIGVDHASALQLAMHMFGEGEELIGDMLGETANIFMGVLKANLSVENFAFTGGLPAPIDPELVLRPTTTYQHQAVFALRVSDARLVVHVGLRSKANSFLTPGALAEGMVLAKDVFNGRGMMLVTAGTRLSTSMIERLRNTLESKTRVEVMA